MLIGPRVFLRRKAAQLVALAVYELTINAGKHGIFGGPEGQVQVDWQFGLSEKTPTLVLVWEETGAENLAELKETGFGTMILTETLHDELRTRAAAAYAAGSPSWTCRIR